MQGVKADAPDRYQAFKEAWSFNDKEEKWLRNMAKGYTLNLCSGGSQLGDVTVDIAEKADIQADMRYLPFKPLSFDTVIWDPPFKFYYNLKQSIKVLHQLDHIVKKRMILVGLQYFLPYMKAFTPKLYYSRYKRIWIRWYVVYDRVIEGFEQYLLES